MTDSATVFIDKHGCSLVLMLRPHHLEQSFLVCTHYCSLVFRSQLGQKLHVRETFCSRSAVRASDTLTGSFARYKFVTYLLACLLA